MNFKEGTELINERNSGSRNMTVNPKPSLTSHQEYPDIVVTDMTNVCRTPPLITPLGLPPEGQPQAPLLDGNTDHV